MILLAHFDQNCSPYILRIVSRKRTGCYKIITRGINITWHIQWNDCCEQGGRLAY